MGKPTKLRRAPPNLPVLDSNFEPTLDLLGLKINGTVMLPTTEAQLYEPTSILDCLKCSPLLISIVIQHCYSALLIEYKIVMVQVSEFYNQLTQSPPVFLFIGPSPPWLSLIQINLPWLKINQYFG